MVIQLCGTWEARQQGASAGIILLPLISPPTHIIHVTTVLIFLILYQNSRLWIARRHRGAIDALKVTVLNQVDLKNGGKRRLRSHEESMIYHS